ncbi:MAG: hypothetical protein KAH16_02115 [Candidatus Izimaplasma sp.]|nr:hypothetical protein [Candidatus Izimaplasma bacterium]
MHLRTFKRKPLSFILDSFNQKTPQGALPSVRACCDPTAQSGEYYGPHRLWNAKGYPIVEESSKQSHSKKLQDTLWNHSVKITNLNIKL